MRYLYFLSVLALAACAGAPTPIPDSGSADARLYTERCSACHSLPHPARHTPAQWEHLLGVMERHMADRGMEPLAPGERRRILAYLAAHAR